MDIKKVRLDDYEVREFLTHSNGKIAVVDELGSLDINNATKFEGVFVILCQAGRLTLNLNEKTYNAHPNDVIVCMPEIVTQNVLVSTDFRFCSMFVSSDYAFNTLPVQAKGWNARRFFEENPIISISEKEAKVFSQYCRLIKSKFEDTDNRNRDKIIDALVQAFIYDFGNALTRNVAYEPRPMSSAEDIFNRFIVILTQAYPKRRSVAYYADKLNISPKYLSVVCKKTCGKNASKIIDACVVKDIENLLKSSRKSVKEISNELEFPNTSFFGRYVKKNLGLTPNELRRKLNGVEG